MPERDPFRSSVSGRSDSAHRAMIEGPVKFRRESRTQRSWPWIVIGLALALALIWMGTA